MKEILGWHIKVSECYASSIKL